MTDFNELAHRAHKTAVEHGFWQDPRNLGEMLMLVTSELAECLEEDRDGNPLVWFRHKPDCYMIGIYGDHEEARQTPRGGMYLNYRAQCDCDPKPEGQLVEIADAMIRLFDIGQQMVERGVESRTLGAVVELKMDYNDRREYKHGKAY